MGTLIISFRPATSIKMTRFLVVLAVLLPLAMSMAPIYRAKPDKRVFNSYIVNLKDGTNLYSFLELVSETARSNKIDFEVKFRYTAVLNGFSARMPAKMVERIANMDGVDFIEEDQEFGISLVGSWGLDRTDQRFTQLNDKYNVDGTGAGVSVYVIDTGINHKHDDFGGRASFFFDAIDPGNQGEDCNGHGTHCAGTIGGLIYGIAKDVKLYSVRVLNCNGFGLNSYIVAGMDAVATAAQHPAVASMSLGGPASAAMDEAATRMKAAGVTLVVAAGNDNQNACDYSPARSRDAITVAAIDNRDYKSYYSNYGQCVQIFAPGDDITSAWIGGDRAINIISGTSMACPHVSGAAAIALGHNSTMTPDQVENKLYSDSTKDAIYTPLSPNRLVYVN